MASQLETADIQSLLLDGLGRLRAAVFLQFRLPDGDRDTRRAKGWLAELGRREVSTDRPADREAPVAQLALTARGLESFGLDEQTRAGFSRPFREGMVTLHRSRALGDVGTNEPGDWDWGHPDKDPFDGLLLLYAPTREVLVELAERHTRELVDAGFQVRALPECRPLVEEEKRPKEHFGFDDGIANPRLPGIDPKGRSEQEVAPGEIVLGYPNETQRFPPSPRIPPGVGARTPLPGGDFGRNGSYLVVRQLEQRVGEFWRYMLADRDAASAVRLSSQMVGRWRNGAPLAHFSKEPPAGDPAADDFDYSKDPHGHRCPIGAHVRRVNPRDAVPMIPDPAKSFEETRRRRLLRRGRSYGASVDGFPSEIERMAKADDGERGLFFLCFNADLESQFEFIQQSWVMSPKFGGLSNDADPLLSNPDAGGKTDFTVQGERGSRRFRGLPSFVRVRGGAYLFMPGKRALEFLAGEPG